MPETRQENTTATGARTTSRTMSIGLWVVALAAIIIGFADLARGGTTLAPVLLVLGYCVLVPLAILK